MRVSTHKVLVRLFVLLLLAGAICGSSRTASASQPQTSPSARAAVQERGGGEANLILPDLSTVTFRGVNARSLLMGGLLVCVVGLLFGLMTFRRLQGLPV